MDFREFAKTMILCALNSGAALQYGGPMYKKAVKRELIGQYAEVFCLNGKESKFFGKLSKKLTSQKAYDIVLMSEECLEDIKNGKTPYYEHIEPISVTFNNLCDLKKPTMIDVDTTMKYCKIVGLSKKQKYLLDNGQFFNQKDWDLLNKWEKDGVVDDILANEARNSMKLGADWLDTMDNGTAYARMAHLINNGVKFVWGADPNPRPGKFQEETISDYLKNKEYNYKI